MNEHQMQTLTPASGWKDTIRRNRDLAVVMALAGILIAILVPLPGRLMDGLLGANIGLSVLVLLTVVYLRKPLEFAAFPSLLLLATLYRLALNIATTRLVLSRAGDEGVSAAGDVVHFFGEFVSGSNLIVGFIIFSILVVIQFVVVTKGATRIAEVAARFTLDRMPGAQMAIDADLNAGNITGDEARTAREELAGQADFYGAMDGASKFVRGDAIAAIIITIINIVGGFTIGVLQYGMTFAEAGRVFTTLTIGDGLVTQIPALFISVAAGLMVTRASTKGQIGDAVVGQLFGNPRALAITALILVALAFTGLPPGVLGVLAVSLAAVAYWSRKPKQEQIGSETAVAEPSLAGTVATTEDARQGGGASTRHFEFSGQQPIRIELGYGLQSLIEPESSGVALNVRVQQLREDLQKELGFWIPPVHARVQIRGIPRQEFSIQLREIPCSRGVLRARKALIVSDHRRSIDGIAGDAAELEILEAPAKWVSLDEGDMRKSLGYRVLTAQDALILHLRNVIMEHIQELLTQRETRRILERVGEECRTLVDEVVPDLLRVGEIQKILQSLLAEGVSIRDMEKILETLGEEVQQRPEARQDLTALAETVRTVLGRSICTQYLDQQGKLHVVTLDPQIESVLLDDLEPADRAGNGPCLSPQLHETVMQALVMAVHQLVENDHPAVILTSPRLRRPIKKLLEKEVPTVAVLSYNEVGHGTTVESGGMARIVA